MKSLYLILIVYTIKYNLSKVPTLELIFIIQKPIFLLNNKLLSNTI